jgi:hypothetical protein
VGDDIEMGKLGPVLEDVLRRQGRSVLQATLVAASLTGLGAQAVAQRLVTFAAAELEDFHRLVQKAHMLGVLPALVIDIPAAEGSENSLRQLIEDETAGLAALHGVIPLAGQRPESEALEHLVEHILYRKHEQLEFLQRAVG